MAAVPIIFGYIVLIWQSGWLGLAAAAVHIAVLLAAAWRPKGREASRTAPVPATTDCRTEPGGAQATGADAHDHGGSRRDHFTRHAVTPGWIYVARNDLHAADLLKVGYTTVGPKARLRALNEQGASVTAAVGEFTLVHWRQVPQSYTAEQQAFGRLAPYRARQHREFFQAPFAVIMQAVDDVADAMSERAQGADPYPPPIDSCPCCGSKRPAGTDGLERGEPTICVACGHAWVGAALWAAMGPSKAARADRR